METVLLSVGNGIHGIFTTRFINILVTKHKADVHSFLVLKTTLRVVFKLT